MRTDHRLVDPALAGGADSGVNSVLTLRVEKCRRSTNAIAKLRGLYVVAR